METNNNQGGNTDSNDKNSRRVGGKIHLQGSQIVSSTQDPLLAFHDPPMPHYESINLLIR